MKILAKISVINLLFINYLIAQNISSEVWIDQICVSSSRVNVLEIPSGFEIRDVAIDNEGAIYVILDDELGSCYLKKYFENIEVWSKYFSVFPFYSNVGPTRLEYDNGDLFVFGRTTIHPNINTTIYDGISFNAHSYIGRINPLNGVFTWIFGVGQGFGCEYNCIGVGSCSTGNNNQNENIFSFNESNVYVLRGGCGNNNAPVSYIDEINRNYGTLSNTLDLSIGWGCVNNVNVNDDYLIVDADCASGGAQTRRYDLNNFPPNYQSHNYLLGNHKNSIVNDNGDVISFSQTFGGDLNLYLWNGGVNSGSPINAQNSSLSLNFDNHGDWSNPLPKSYAHNDFVSFLLPFQSDSILIPNQSQYINSYNSASFLILDIDYNFNILNSIKVTSSSDFNSWDDSRYSISKNGNKCLSIKTDGELCINNNIYTGSFGTYKNYIISSIYSIGGNVFVDLDSNSVFDNQDFGLEGQIIELKNNNLLQYVSTDYNGNYSFNVDSGTYNISYSPDDYFSLSSTGLYNFFLPDDTTISDLDFGVSPEFTKGDMSINLTSSDYVCSESVQLWINLRNEGTETISGGLIVELFVNQTSSINSVSSNGQVNGNIVSWNLPADFEPHIYSGQESFFNVIVNAPNQNMMGNVLIDSVRVTTLQTNLIELDYSNNYNQIQNIVLCSFDPNDKNILPKKCFYNELDTIEYTIRFQNTGNYPATTVKIVDTLDINKLDILTLEVVGVSHDYNWSLRSPSVLEVVFNNINLVDSSVSFSDSQGFFKYKILVRDTLDNFSSTSSPAYIYFDYNPPIITNAPELTFDPSVLDAYLQKNNISCNGFNDGSIFVNILNGTPPFNINWNNGDTSLNILNLSPGYYNLTLTDSNNCFYNDSIEIEEPPLISIINDVNLCDGQSLLVGNNLYNISGIYYDTLVSLYSCDSIVTTNLNIYPQSFSSSEVITCDSLLWNGNVYNSSGNYNFITSNIYGCDSVASLELTINNSITTSSNFQLCDGDSINLDNQVYFEPGIYINYFPLSNGCDSLNIININFNDSINVSIVESGNNLVALPSGGNMVYNFEWNTGDTTQLISPLSDGEYWVIVGDTNQCYSDTIYYEFTWFSNDIYDINSNFVVSPNPSSTGVFNYKFNGLTENTKLLITNTLGQVVFQKKLNYLNSIGSIDLRKNSSGLYFLRLSHNNKIFNKILKINKCE